VLDEASHAFLIEKGYDPTYGARPMRRAVERYLEDPMAEEILRGSFKAGDNVEVTRDGEKLSFKVSGGKPPAKAKKAKG
jgi:ATP-dependent Clp protease ATP-binding subunit ClpA